MKVSLFDLWSLAFSINDKIFDTVLSPKLLVVRTVITPEMLTHPEKTSSPTPTSRGTLSPVKATVFREVAPSVTTPSRGIFSPGRMTMLSPTDTSSGLTVRVLPSRSTLAVSGRMSIRWAMLSRLFPSAYPSKSSPIWKKSITKTASGNCVSAPGRNPMPRAPSVATDIRKCSLNASPCASPSAASFNVSKPMSRYGTR